MNDWIAVTDRLPELVAYPPRARDGKVYYKPLPVLVVADGNVYVANYRYDEYCEYCNIENGETIEGFAFMEYNDYFEQWYKVENVTHWMPFPLPPTT